MHYRLRLKCCQYSFLQNVNVYICVFNAQLCLLFRLILNLFELDQ